MTDNAADNVVTFSEPKEALPDVMAGTIVGGRFYEYEQTEDTKRQVAEVKAMIDAYMAALTGRLRVEPDRLLWVGDTDYEQLQAALPLQFAVNNSQLRPRRLSPDKVVCDLPQTAKEAWEDIRTLLDHVMPNDGGRIAWHTKPHMFFSSRSDNDMTQGWYACACVWCEPRKPPSDVSKAPVTVVRYEGPEDWLQCVAAKAMGDGAMAWLRANIEYVTDDIKNRQFIAFADDCTTQGLPGGLHGQCFVDALNRRFVDTKTKPD